MPSQPTPQELLNEIDFNTLSREAQILYKYLEVAIGGTSGGGSGTDMTATNAILNDISEHSTGTNNATATIATETAQANTDRAAQSVAQLQLLQNIFTNVHSTDSDIVIGNFQRAQQSAALQALATAIKNSVEANTTQGAGYMPQFIAIAGATDATNNAVNSLYNAFDNAGEFRITTKYFSTAGSGGGYAVQLPCNEADIMNMYDSIVNFLINAYSGTAITVMSCNTFLFSENGKAYLGFKILFKTQ